jgi:hypothetical protein
MDNIKAMDNIDRKSRIHRKAIKVEEAQRLLPEHI